MLRIYVAKLGTKQPEGGDDEERSEERLAEVFCMMERRLKNGEKNEE